MAKCCNIYGLSNKGLILYEFSQLALSITCEHKLIYEILAKYKDVAQTGLQPGVHLLSISSLGERREAGLSFSGFSTAF